MQEILSNSEIIESINKIISTLEVDEDEFYVLLETAYQLRDELLQNLELETE